MTFSTKKNKKNTRIIPVLLVFAHCSIAKLMHLPDRWAKSRSGVGWPSGVLGAVPVGPISNVVPVNRWSFSFLFPLTTCQPAPYWLTGQSARPVGSSQTPHFFTGLWWRNTALLHKNGALVGGVNCLVRPQKCRAWSTGPERGAIGTQAHQSCCF